MQQVINSLLGILAVIVFVVLLAMSLMVNNIAASIISATGAVSMLILLIGER